MLHRSKLDQTENRKEVKNMLFSPKEKGQGLVEYALILVLIAVVVIVILAVLGPAIGNIFSNIAAAL
jgi:pilus assembly protein Flp/PilA